MIMFTLPLDFRTFPRFSMTKQCCLSRPRPLELLGNSPESQTNIEFCESMCFCKGVTYGQGGKSTWKSFSFPGWRPLRLAGPVRKCCPLLRRPPVPSSSWGWVRARCDCSRRRGCRWRRRWPRGGAARWGPWPGSGWCPSEGRDRDRST